VSNFGLARSGEAKSGESDILPRCLERTPRAIPAWSPSFGDALGLLSLPPSQVALCRQRSTDAICRFVAVYVLRGFDLNLWLLRGRQTIAHMSFHPRTFS